MPFKGHYLSFKRYFVPINAAEDRPHWQRLHSCALDKNYPVLTKVYEEFIAANAYPGVNASALQGFV